MTARVKLLELPELAQQMIGDGRLALSCVEQLRAIGAVSPGLLDALISYLADGNEWAAERLLREPGWVLDSAMRQGDSKVFAAHLSRVDRHDVAALRLGKKAEAAYERPAELTRALDRYAYGVDVRFAEREVDQARAAGVLIEFEPSSPIIVDRSLYRELVKPAITRTVSELETKLAAREQQRKTARQSQKSGNATADPAKEAEREHRARMRELSDQAHGVNLDVGAGLLTGLSTVDPADLTVARFFVYSLLGSDYDQSPYTQTGERIARLAVSGIRLVIEELRADVTKTARTGPKVPCGSTTATAGSPRRPSGGCGSTSTGPRPPESCTAARWRSSPPSNTPRGWRCPRASARTPSHKDLAAKALSKLAGPHLPASLRQLEAAVKRAHEEHERACTRARAAAQRASVDAGDSGDAATPEAPDVEGGVDSEVDVEQRPVDPASEDGFTLPPLRDEVNIRSSRHQ